VYSPPPYVWALCLIGAIGFPAATCLTLYRGARSAGSPRPHAALLAAGAAVVLGGWLVASGEIAARGYYQNTVGRLPFWASPPAAP